MENNIIIYQLINHSVNWYDLERAKEFINYTRKNKDCTIIAKGIKYKNGKVWNN